MIPKVVIGAGYGDEGKGLITDYYASKAKNPLVIRFNGGSQAGHTVVTPEGKRHVFSHFGSGTFVGAPTYLSKYFVCDPMIFLKERKNLHDLGVEIPIPFVHDDCLITTPFDILINQTVESSRGEARHGSCGSGFGETIERNLNAEFRLKGFDLIGGDIKVRLKLHAFVCNVWRKYVEKRLNALGVYSDSPEAVKANLFLDSFPWNKWIDNVLEFRNSINFCGDGSLGYLKDRYDFIFEGAQGLMLDMDHGAFPYVTRSNTGLKNVLALCEQAKIKEIEVTYVTRAYVTRHGRGPLAHEVNSPDEISPLIEEKTNTTGVFQEHFRYAPIDPQTLNTVCLQDESYLYNNLSVTILNSRNAITCMDQIEGYWQYVHNDSIVYPNNKESFLSGITIPGDLVSYGPTRNDVKIL